MKSEQPVPISNRPVPNAVTALDPLTALELELNRRVEAAEILQYFAHGLPALALRAGEILRRCNIDVLLGVVEGTPDEKLALQEDIYTRLDVMLNSGSLYFTQLAVDIASRSTSPRALKLLRNHPRLRRRLA